MIKSKGQWFENFMEFQAFVEIQSKHEIKVFQWMNEGDSILRGFEVFLIE
jgi:hypothetical protein